MRYKLILFLLIISTSIFGQKISKQLEYEDIDLIDGNTISSADLENKVIVVNLWGTWCKPCIQELPDLNDIYAKYKDDHRIMFFAIAEPRMDSPEKIMKFLEKRSFEFQHIIPATESIFFNLIGTVKYPTTVIYNSKGELQKKFVDTLTEKEIDKIIAMLDELVEESGI
jgi:thiol-disulfide isomerase/thioredoxin